MKQDLRSSKNIKAILFSRLFLPLMALALLMMAGSIASTWFGATKTGHVWTTNAASGVQSLIESINDEAKLARSIAETKLASNGPLRPIPGFAIVSVTSTGTIELIAEPPSPNLANAVIDFRKVTKAGYYRIGNYIAHAQPIGDHTVSNDVTPSLYLVRVLDNALAERLAAELRAEVSFILAGPAPKFTTSSWRSESGLRILPVIDHELRKDLMETAVGAMTVSAARYEIPGYRGFKPSSDDSLVYHRGESEFRAFHAFRAIPDPTGQAIGYYIVAVPEGAVLSGPAAAIAVIAVLGLIALFCSVWLHAHVAEAISDPIKKIASDIDDLAGAVHKRYEKYRVERAPSWAPPASNEIQALSTSVETLSKEIRQVEKIDRMIEAERERSQMSAKMAALGELIASVAHEINNPVSIIFGAADEILRKNAKGPLLAGEVEQKALMIRRTSERISVIVRTLLRFSRNAARDPMEPHAVKGLVEDAIMLVRDKIKAQNIFLDLGTIDPDVRVKCRGVQISQVILNLLNNAADAIDRSEERSIQIRVKKVMSSVIITVTDSGPGIDPSIKDRLMEPFVTTKAPGKGTGLGLSLSRQIIEEHGGELYVDSKSRRTRFVVRLPVSFRMRRIDFRQEQ